MLQLFNPNKSVTSSLHLSHVKLCPRMLNLINQSTLPSVTHVSNLVHGSIRINQSPSSLHLSRQTFRNGFQSDSINQLFHPLITRQTWCNFSIQINQSPPPSIYHVSNLAHDAYSDSINQLFHPLITCQTWCNFSIRTNQSPPPSIYHVSNLA